MPYPTDSADPHAPLYTVAEAKAEIRLIDAEIAVLRKKPTMASVEGVGSVSQSGKLETLRKERSAWMQRLKEAAAYEQPDGRSPIQGPRQILE